MQPCIAVTAAASSHEGSLIWLWLLASQQVGRKHTGNHPLKQRVALKHSVGQTWKKLRTNIDVCWKKAPPPNWTVNLFMQNFKLQPQPPSVQPKYQTLCCQDAGLTAILLPVNARWQLTGSTGILIISNGWQKNRYIVIFIATIWCIHIKFK